MDNRESIELFSMSFDGRDMAFELPVAWAPPVTGVNIFLAQQGVLGWHGTVCTGELPILHLTWFDDLDQMLREEDPELPTRAPECAWDTLDQCWWISITRYGADLLLADGDSDELTHRAPGRPRLIGPGRVDVGGSEVLWHRVSVAEYEAAWDEARRRLLTA